MALKSTIFKIDLQVTDLDRNYYQSHSLTVARHPSENDERMMFRILAYALNASDRLTFTRGISTDNEPDIWQKELDDEIALWIDLGQPDEKRIRKACGRADRVVIYTYKERSAAVWWEQIKSKLSRFGNLVVVHLKAADPVALENMASRNMQLQCTIQEGKVWLSDQQGSQEIDVMEYTISR